MSAGKAPLDTVHHVMDRSVIALRSDWTIRKSLSLLREAPQESLYYLYVTDKDGKLVGVVSMRHMLLAQPLERIETIMSREIVSVREDMTREEVLALSEQKRFVAFPVTDVEGRLVGAIRPSELMQIAQAEAGASFQRFFGAGGDERALSPVGFAVRKRLPWLQINLGTAFLASAVVAIFEKTIDRVTALAVLLPIVAGQGGNAGAQAMAVVIRALAVKEIAGGKAWRVIFKELALGLVNGAAVALVTAAAVMAWYREWRLALVIGVAMIVNMAAAGVSGAGIPIFMKRIGLDPAQSSSIIMTTVTDVVGFLSFLGLATLLLGSGA